MKIKKCVECGKEFEAFRKRIVCSEECSKFRMNRRNNEKRREIQEYHRRKYGIFNN